MASEPHHGGHPGHHILFDDLDDLAEQRRLVRELVIHRAAGDPRGARNFRCPHVRVATSPPQLAGSRNQRIAGRRRLEVIARARTFSMADRPDRLTDLLSAIAIRT